MKIPIYKVRLTKVRSNHTNLRTNTVEGETVSLPEKGKSFTLIADPLNPNADFRSVETTAIELVEKMGSEFMFHTQNSTYKLEVLGQSE